MCGGITRHYCNWLYEDLWFMIITNNDLPANRQHDHCFLMSDMLSLYVEMEGTPSLSINLPFSHWNVIYKLVIAPFLTTGELKTMKTFTKKVNIQTKIIETESTLFCDLIEPSPKAPFRSFSRKPKKGTRYPCLGQGCGTCIFRIQSFTTPRRPQWDFGSFSGWLVPGGIFWRPKKHLGSWKKTGA